MIPDRFCKQTFLACQPQPSEGYFLIITLSDPLSLIVNEGLPVNFLFTSATNT